MTRSVTLLVVVLNYRTPDMTADAVDAALKEMEELRGHLILVDNDSGDGSFERLQRASQKRGWGDRVTLVESGHNGGFGAGNNFGIRTGLKLVSPDYVYILNSDAFPDKGAICRLVDVMEARPEVGIAGSYIHGPDGAPHITAFRFPTIKGEFEGAARVGPVSRVLDRHVVPLPLPKETCEVDWLAGASMIIRPELLEVIGLFDERFFLYFEETDLCLRARRAGWTTVYVRDSEVTHIGSVSTGMKTWSRMPTYWFDSRRYYFTMNHGKFYAAFATMAHFAGGCLWRVWRVLTRKDRRDPDRFLLDLIAHDLRWRAPNARAAPSYSPLPHTKGGVS
ncbi:glycosyltransferase family 2 protein [Shimia sp. SDUM112013]|uniref:glycosyltransferase family 2 protein n=1 Tax=Shimia sp. SDUM112013 TaxID=3136160 RepID=UPI0032EB5EDA